MWNILTFAYTGIKDVEASRFVANINILHVATLGKPNKSINKIEFCFVDQMIFHI